MGWKGPVLSELGEGGEERPSKLYLDHRKHASARGPRRLRCHRSSRHWRRDVQVRVTPAMTQDIADLQGFLGMWSLETAGGWAELVMVNCVLWEGRHVSQSHSRAGSYLRLVTRRRVGPAQPLPKGHTVHMKPGTQIQGHGFQSLSSGDTARMSAL